MKRAILHPEKLRMGGDDLSIFWRADIQTGKTYEFEQSTKEEYKRGEKIEIYSGGKKRAIATITRDSSFNRFNCCIEEIF